MKSLKLTKKSNVHPNSIKNLVPYKPGESGNQGSGQGYSVTSEVKHMLSNKEKRQQIAQTMIDESIAGNVPMVKELLDRTEGKVPGDLPRVGGLNIIIEVTYAGATKLGKGYQDLPLEVKAKEIGNGTG